VALSRTKKQKNKSLRGFLIFIFLINKDEKKLRKWPVESDKKVIVSQKSSNHCKTKRKDPRSGPIDRN
jgi:hypothetical protein